MTPEVFNEWKSIVDWSITDNGQWIHYGLKTEVGDSELKVYEVASQKTYTFPRYKNPTFSSDGQYLCFMSTIAHDSLRQLKIKKVDKKEFPKDTLNIYHLQNKTLTRIPNINTYSMPDDWSPLIAYDTHYEIEKTDSTGAFKAEKKEISILRNLISGTEDTLSRIQEIEWSKTSRRATFSRSGKDSLQVYGVFRYDFENKQFDTLFQTKGDYSNLSISEDGEKVAFIADLDTSEQFYRPYSLYLWEGSSNLCRQIIARDQALVEDMYLNKNKSCSFSKDGNRLFFGYSQKEKQKDSLILDEERPVVEVWSTQDAKLYTEQNNSLTSDLKKTYDAYWDTDKKEAYVLETSEIPYVRIAQEQMGDFALGLNAEPYSKASSWTGRNNTDAFLLNLSNHTEQKIASNLEARPQLSPNGQYVHYYHYADSSYYTISTRNLDLKRLTNPETLSVHDETHDEPISAESYRDMGWTSEDNAYLIYDRYDIWSLDPNNNAEPKRLTQGREKQIRYRYIQLDREEENLPDSCLLYFFDENSKTSGYAQFIISTGELRTITTGTYIYSRYVKKAKESNQIVFTRENVQDFPNLWTSSVDLKNAKQISDANPQQSEYRWIQSELLEWKAFDGTTLQGMLFKPDDFDPKKKYPLLVNFYERSSDGLNSHREPYAHRSTINYAYYVNRGYLIFNPDVVYSIGDPGESAYNAVISGVEELKKLNYIDTTRIGVQGHSWGGYQVAHLLTKTNVFACAESGAPVVNMTSAYGGIRWGSGRSRMFQYENTQSRIGATLWEDQASYIRNSPLFELDKVETPVLILHNDHDGAVPWYQGIEYFVALRRLNKDAWLLNYKDEPHWPLKYPNRLDFQTRMSQFFDSYLLDEEAPRWMKNGIPAVDAEFDLGY